VGTHTPVHTNLMGGARLWTTRESKPPANKEDDAAPVGVTPSLAVTYLAAGSPWGHQRTRGAGYLRYEPPAAKSVTPLIASAPLPSAVVAMEWVPEDRLGGRLPC